MRSVSVAATAQTASINCGRRDWPIDCSAVKRIRGSRSVSASATQRGSGDAETPAFVLLLAVAKLGAELCPPAGEVEGAIGSGLYIDRIEERIAGVQKRFPLAAGGLEQRAVPVRAVHVRLAMEKIV